MRSSTKLLLALSLMIIAPGAAAWLIGSVGDLHDRVAKISPYLAIVLISLAALAAAASTLAAARILWKLGREPKAKARAPADVVKAAEIQAEKAEAVIAKVTDLAAKVRLQTEIANLRTDRDSKRFHVVVFGTGSAGKTSLINALLGHPVGKTEATMGTTRHGETHQHELSGVEGTLVLTDTPGLSEVGQGGAVREAEARDLAARADLLLFVVDHDLVRSEYEPLIALAKQGKRSIVVLNKRDRLVDEDLGAILNRLRERLAGVVPSADVVPVAADPRPTIVRVRGLDGSIETVVERESPDLGSLLGRIAVTIKREGENLRAGNLLLRAHLISQEAQDQLTRERRVKAQTVVDKFQWITAATVFTNPIPVLDLVASSAVRFQMISEIAAVYGVELSMSDVRKISGHMVELLLKLGLVEAATSLMAGVFKSSMVGFAAGGAIQATTMAYLTHIAGQTFTEYFERGQTWGDGGMQAALIRQFDLNSRADFLREFAQQAMDRVVRKALGPKDRAPTRQG